MIFLKRIEILLRGIERLFISKNCRFGMIVPFVLMTFILLNKPFVKNNPIVSWLIFYGSMPAYIYCIGYRKNKKFGYKKPDPRVNEMRNQTYQTKQANYRDLDCISENKNIEKVVRITTTTEEIVFNKEDRYYRDAKRE